MDETTAPVLSPGRKKTKTGYFWALARDDRQWVGDDPPAVAFTCAPGRSGQHAEKIMQGFSGILQVDGYVYRRHEVLSVAKDLVGAQPLTASIQGSSFKVTMTSKFSEENNEKGETGESDASVL